MKVNVMLLLLVRCQELLQVEAGHGHHVGAHVQAGVQQDIHAVDVEERQHAHHHGVAVQAVGAEPHADLQNVRHEVAVAQTHALRHTRGARRVRQHRHVGRRVDGDFGRGAALPHERLEASCFVGEVDDVARVDPCLFCTLDARFSQQLGRQHIRRT